MALNANIEVSRCRGIAAIGRYDCEALSVAYICFPDLRGFLLYRFLERTNVVQRGAVRLHVRWTIQADRVDVHQELLEQGGDDGGRGSIKFRIQKGFYFLSSDVESTG